MKRIGIISDTHGFLPPGLQKFLLPCDEVWHAGDWGNMDTIETLRSWVPEIRGVYGNIDGQEIRQQFPEILRFQLEGVKVCMLHIGGYPGHYSPAFKKALVEAEHPDLMICGHSHILKVMRDPNLGMMHINPGAAGYHGFHTKCTAIRLTISGGKLADLEVWEHNRPGRMQPDANKY